jgi:hypothetical protein
MIMKSPRFYHTLFILVLHPALYAQPVNLDTIQYNGDPAKFINLVFMGDGYRADELTDYRQHVEAFAEYFFGVSPFAEYRNYFNVFAIQVISEESGADHPATATDVSEPVFPAANVNTHFNSSFDFGGIHRLLVPLNASATHMAIAQFFPQTDQRLMLVNIQEYGGSGGLNATSSINVSGYEIALHEVAHSFADLADEYYAGDIYAAEKANMTQNTNPATVRWKNWIGTDQVGIYQHCCGGSSALWYRPHEACKMRYLGVEYPFCPVCREALVERIHTLFGDPVVAEFPEENNISICDTTKLSFHTNLIKPEPNTMSMQWLLNGEPIAGNTDSIEIDPAQLNDVFNEISLEIFDDTWMVRHEDHLASHVYFRKWNIIYDPVPVPEISVMGSVLISSAASGNQWLLDGDPIPDANDTLLVAFTSGYYSVEVTGSGGCSNISEPVWIDVTHTDEQSPKTTFALSPNPGNGYFNLRSSSHELVKATVFDIHGQVISETKFIQDTILDLTDQPQGVYVVHITTDNSIAVIRGAIVRPD